MAEEGIAYRLGYALYWVCLILGVLWVGFWWLVLGEWDGGVILFLILSALLAYGLGRFFRYVLAGE